MKQLNFNFQETENKPNDKEDNIFKKVEKHYFSDTEKYKDIIDVNYLFSNKTIELSEQIIIDMSDKYIEISMANAHYGLSYKDSIILNEDYEKEIEFIISNIDLNLKKDNEREFAEIIEIDLRYYFKQVFELLWLDIKEKIAENLTKPENIKKLKENNGLVKNSFSYLSTELFDFSAF